MNPLARLRADLQSPKLFRAVTLGWLMGAVIVIHCIALSAIVFSGPMLPYAVQGAGMMLFGGIVFCLLIGVTSSYPGMLAVPQEVPATVLGTLGVVVGGTVSAPGHVQFMTMAALLLLSGLLTGLLFLTVGHFRLSHLFRFIPYPVAGGFFAGSGWVLSLAALSVMSGMALDWQTLPRIFESDMVWKWGPGAAYGLVLTVAMKQKGNLAVMMGSVVLVSALYHVGLLVLDISVEDAKALGLLMSGIPEGGLWPAFGPDDLGAVDWRVVAGQVPTLLTVTLVTLLCLLVYVNGLEVATGVEVDLNREFRVAGLASMCAGAGGSGPGCHAFVFTLPCRMLGADTPWTGVVVAVVLTLSLFFGSGILELLPMSIIGGLLLFIGVDLLDKWLVQARGRLHWSDYSMIVLICITIAVFGFVEGVALGMLATLALFTIRLSRVDVIAEEFTARQRRSTMHRSVPDRAILYDRGELLRGYRLRGYIFFGSAHPLIEELKRPLGESPSPSCILLDFAAVSGCDLSAANVLCQFVQLAHRAGVRTVFSEVSRQLEGSLRRNLPVESWEQIWFEPDFESGLERCEELLIKLATSGPSGPKDDERGRLFDRVADELERHLDELAIFEGLLERLDPWLEPREYAEGETLSLQGEVRDGGQLLVSGLVSVHDAEGTRLHHCGPGDVLDPWSAFEDKNVASTTAIARTPCRTMMLTPVARERLESDDNELTLRFFTYIIRRQPPSGLVLDGD